MAMLRQYPVNTQASASGRVLSEKPLDDLDLGPDEDGNTPSQCQTRLRSCKSNGSETRDNDMRTGCSRRKRFILTEARAKRYRTYPRARLYTYAASTAQLRPRTKRQARWQILTAAVEPHGSEHSGGAGSDSDSTATAHIPSIAACTLGALEGQTSTQGNKRYARRRQQGKLVQPSGRSDENDSIGGGSSDNSDTKMERYSESKVDTARH
ncbi:hypothetical protein CC86DRAFT_383521 [Ophiobolus disseminans]|uniref:Uncharacterized protein n=1 Tax=Ophiobolus disseminans TaxID=1469910 RepID=A0A6A6ZV59_9PLEO|nr:hypothetical protein CC86DRAFT_383521 [Ophiobolus disseminans]